MDENKSRRRWLSFGIRDLLWAMALLAMGLGWGRERWKNDKRDAFINERLQRENAGLRLVGDDVLIKRPRGGWEVVDPTKKRRPHSW